MQQRLTIYAIHFFIKGWFVGLIVLLPFLQKELSLNLIEIGLLSATVTVASIFGAFFAGNIQSKLGTRNVIL